MLKSLGHLDDAFAYETQKIVRIRDRRLGLTYIGFVILIASYVLGFQIFFSNEHFQRKDVFGTARMTIQQPTKNCNPNKRGCKSNFRPLTELPYCSHYKGNSTEVAPKNRHDCVFADQHTLAPTGMLTGEMLVPTRIDRMSETKGCEPSAENGYSCDNEYELDHDENVIYVADIEKFTIMLSHTYKRSTIEGNNQNIQGFLLECEEEKRDVLKAQLHDFDEALQGKKECNGKMVKKPIECINGKCPFLKDAGHEQVGFLEHLPAADSTHQQASRRKAGMPATLLAVEDHADLRVNPAKLAAGGYFAIAQGDIFRVDKLLQLAGKSLDGKESFNSEGEPLREAGTVLEIEIIYSNLHPWLSSFGNTEVSYSYKVSARPMDEMKTELFSQSQPDFPKRRIIEDRHGLYIVAKISGEFGFFSIVYLGVMLTTAVALISVAVAITDKLAIYVMPEKESYKAEKYTLTERIYKEEVQEVPQ